MHNLFLGDLAIHCRHIWGMNDEAKNQTSSKVAPQAAEQQMQQLQNVSKAIQAQSRSALHRLRKGYVVAVAKANRVGLPPGMKDVKSSWENVLISWVTLSLLERPRC
jgi:hypothetical protein